MTGAERAERHRIEPDDLAAVVETIAGEFAVPVERIWVHGSQNPDGRQQPRPSSDLDLLVYVPDGLLATPDGWDVLFHQVRDWFAYGKVEQANIEGWEVEVHWTTTMNDDTFHRATRCTELVGEAVDVR